MKKSKLLVFSNVFQFILLLTGGILLTLVLISYGVPRLLTFLIIFMFYIGFSAVRPFYIIYKSKSLRSINRYVTRNNKRPIFSYSYALANGNQDDVEVALKRIMNSYSQGDMQDIYGAQLALFQNNSKKVLEHAMKIDAQEYKDYYQGLAFVLNGNFARAEEFLAALHTPWMKESMRAFAALQRDNLNDFRSAAEQSVDSAVGMQRFVLHHMMRRLEVGEFFKN